LPVRRWARDHNPCRRGKVVLAIVSATITSLTQPCGVWTRWSGSSTAGRPLRPRIVRLRSAPLKVMSPIGPLLPAPKRRHVRSWGKADFASSPATARGSANRRGGGRDAMRGGQQVPAGASAGQRGNHWQRRPDQNDVTQRRKQRGARGPLGLAPAGDPSNL